MNQNYQTPGVYVEEISTFPPSVVAVETAIPAFIGYTAQNVFGGKNLQNVPVRISSMLDFETIFGGPFPEIYTLNAELRPDGTYQLANEPFGANPTATHSGYRLYYGLQAFYQNGGGPCYVVSVGTYAIDPNPKVPEVSDLTDGLNALKKFDEPTLICFPDATGLGNDNDFYDLYKLALQQCASRQDRFTIIDTYASDDLGTNIDDFRQGIGINNLSYGAVYYPWLASNIPFYFDESAIQVNNILIEYEDANNPNTFIDVSSELRLKYDLSADALSLLADPPANFGGSKADYYGLISLFHTNNSSLNQLYQVAVQLLNAYTIPLPPSAAIAGVYAAVDNSRGVFKAPANISLNGVSAPLIKIDDKKQASMNVHPSGKSVNAIRTFKDKGILVWGARTLAGNDNEWKYVPVRRYFLYVEESTKKASEQFVYEPNDINTWSKVRAMIENFLFQEWQSGALQGSKPEQAFKVSIGLGETMTPQDLLEGRMIVEIALAVVRPAEFIVLRFSHIMQRV